MERWLTKMSRVVPMLSDRPSRSHTCIVYTPCDYSRRPSQLLHYTSDTPTMYTQQTRFTTSSNHTHGWHIKELANPGLPGKWMLKWSACMSAKQICPATKPINGCRHVPRVSPTRTCSTVPWTRMNKYSKCDKM